MSARARRLILWLVVAVVTSACAVSGGRQAVVDPTDPLECATGGSAGLDPERLASLPFRVGYADASVSYRAQYPFGADQQRDVPIRIWYPTDFDGRAPVVLVSHGGIGCATGHTSFAYLGQEFAGNGYLSVHLAHLPSADEIHQRWDRPQDVSAVLDAIIDDPEALPEGFTGELDAGRVGHLGHSWGAYAAHALAGAEFLDPFDPEGPRVTFRDPRVDAFVALSPQGWGQFGSFDVEHDLATPSPDNSWRTVSTPAYNLVGSLEADGVAGYDLGLPGTYRGQDWRMFPFARYPADGRRYLTVLEGQTHANLGGEAAAEVNAFVAANSRTFFDAYLRGDTESEPRIGDVLALPDALTDRR
ncbi:MAG: hypothetical protein H6525_03125 [Actinobacteria bacterium]|nr:hypothetical protein [Actinomycetota bacterium]